MSCGAALLNLRLAMRMTGSRPVVDVLPKAPDELIVARVTRGRARVPSSDDRALFDAIPLRRTNRRPFSPERPAGSALADLARAAAAEGAQAMRIHGSDVFDVMDLVHEANVQQGADSAVRAEIGSWVHGDESRFDGLPVSSLGPLAVTERALVRDFGFGQPAERRGHSTFEENPVLLVLTTPGDTQSHWVAAGQALQRTQLEATTLGLATSFLGQPFETGLRDAIGSKVAGDGIPQMLLRVGYAPDSPATPRRPVHEVVRPRRLRDTHTRHDTLTS
jgi:hypothetical protein